MIDPLFWLGLSFLLVAVSLTAVLIAALPAFQELARAARSVEKLADTLRRELPPTLESIRLTGMEISELTDDVNEGVKSASQVVKQVDRSISGVTKQAQNVQATTRGVFAGVKAAWKSFNRPSAPRRSIERIVPSQRQAIEPRIPPNGTSSPRSNAAKSLGSGSAEFQHKGLPEASSKVYWDGDAYGSESASNVEADDRDASSASFSPEYYEDEELSNPETYLSKAVSEEQLDEGKRE